MKLSGVLSAVATPLDPDGGIDEARLRLLVENTIAGGVHGLVPAGSTGEFAQLSIDERRTVVEVVLDQAAGRVPVIAHTGAMTTREAVALSRHAAAAGAAALLVLPAYKDRLSLQETIGYFRAVADSVSVPVVVYNLPLATGVNLSPEDLAALAASAENIQYVKDTSGDFHQLTRLVHDYADVITTLIGWDTMFLAALVEGAAGCIYGACNIVTPQLVQVYDAVQRGDLAAAQRTWSDVYPLMRFLVSGGYVAGVKGVLNALGASIGSPRAPLSAMPAERSAELAGILERLDINVECLAAPAYA
jgi:4-hydroxy-tetrahydrodipicolinate synthase